MVSARWLYHFVERECGNPDVQAFVLETARTLHPVLSTETVLATTPASFVIEAKERYQDDRLQARRRDICAAVFSYFRGEGKHLLTFDELFALRSGLDEINRKYNATGYYVLSTFLTLGDQRRSYGVALAAFLEPYFAIIQKEELRRLKEEAQ